MFLQDEREAIVEYGKKLILNGLVKGTGGNISIFDRISGLMAITPGGMDYFAITPADIVLMGLDGQVAEGGKPSSEHRMHSAIYLAKRDIGAVVHTHSPAAAAVAALRVPLPPVSYLAALAGKGSIPCAPYAVFGSEKLARYAAEAMGEGKACLLANHGLLAAGESLAAAFSLAQELEFCADVYLRAKAAGEPIALTPEEMAELQQRFIDYRK